MNNRIFLFAIVNILIVVTFSIVFYSFGLNQFLPLYGLGNYFGLFIFCIFWGMLGSLFSLFTSKWMAKTFMGVQIVSLNGPHQKLVETVHRLSRRAGLTEMPEVGIYQGEELNAFATGPSRNNSLVAVSTGLLTKMNEDELLGVLGHEIAHIANGDMVTLTLLQGVLNAFVMFAARVIAHMIDANSRRDEDASYERRGGGLSSLTYFLIVILLEILFGFLASLVVNWFSRYREFRADHGGADLAGKEKMILALECLQRNYEQLENNSNNDSPNIQNFKAMKISAKFSRNNGLKALFSTHPPLRDRILALKNIRN